MNKIRLELEAWCASYVAAFERSDATAITEHWAFPAITTQAGQSFAFKSSEHFEKNTQRLLGFHQRQGVATVHRRVLNHLEMSAHAVAMTVADDMRDASGATLASWQAAYVLQYTQGKWRAIAAIADGEVAAWAERGTPLGA